MRTAGGLARQLRRRREDLGLTLQDVSRRAAALNEPVPVSTLSQIERGVLDPGVRRLNVLLRICGLDPVVAAELADLEARADALPDEDLPTLRSELDRYWKEGNAPQSLSRIFAILLRTDRDPVGRIERQKALQFCAIVARQFGKLRLARQIVDDLLCEPLEPPLLIDVLVLSSNLWDRRGGIEVAGALLKHAEARIDPTDTRRVSILKHQRAKLELKLNQPESAASLLEAALSGYQAAADTHNEAKARLLRVSVLEKAGRGEEAAEAAREAIAFAEARDHGLVKTLAQIELGRVLLGLGRVEESAQEIRRGLASAVLLEAPNAEYHAHELLARAFDAMGDGSRAKAERARAAALGQWADEDRDANR